MNYIINPLTALDSGIFPLLNAVVDENLRLASALQLRTILFLSRHINENVTLSDISKAVGYDEDEVKDALIFWAERGILVKSDSALVMPVSSQSFTPTPSTKPLAPTPTAPDEPIKTAEAPQTKKVEEIPVVKPSHEQVASRLSESDDLRDLFREAQDILGKTIGYDGQSTLIMMHDSYGLPIEVILMAIEYCATKGKTGFAAISKVGKEWSENEIDSIEGAMEYIESHNIVDETWDKLRRLTEITNKNPTAKQRRLLTAWVKEYKFDADMIFFAYEETIDNTGKINFDYMDKVLLNWYRNGVKTPEDIRREKLKWQQQNKSKYEKPKEKKKAPGERREPTFDVGEFKKKAVNLTYTPPKSDN
ncbi:MAG: DnaD domain protein [Acutalibacteraceae bacterium]